MPSMPEHLLEGSLAVIFISRLKADAPGCEETAQRMVELVKTMPGFLGPAGWRDEESIRRWREQPAHARARRHGAEEWYNEWHIEVCRVERTSRKSPRTR